jgi:DNA (cytosine-5)-methyltransferase 1
MRYGSVCSGMEAASVAWHTLGWSPIFFSEIEPFPCAILKHRFSSVPNHGSLLSYKSWPVEPGAIDLLVGGTPCQSFSVAGMRKGLEDPRGNLALVFLGLTDRLKPRWVVWENVPGVLSSNGGRDFGSFLGALVQLGYGFAYRVLDAQHFGVPQRRRRVFVVACLGDWRAPAEVLLEPDCVRRDIKTGRTTRETTTSSPECGAKANSTVGAVCARDYKGADNIYVEEGKVVLHEQGKPIAFKVRGGGNCSGTKGGEIKPGIGGGTGYLGAEDKTFTVATTQDQWVATQMAVRKLTPLEAERLQGFPDNWSRIPWKGRSEEDCPDGPRYKACGNSMAVPVMRWIGERIHNYELSQNHEAK